MNKLDRSILEILLKNQYTIDKRYLIDGYPDMLASQVAKRIDALRDLGYIVVDVTTTNCILTIPFHMINDAFKAVYPDALRQSQLAESKEEQIPNGYNSKPLFVAKGEKMIHGDVSEYWFCTKKSQSDYVVCFIFSKGILWHRVYLGSLSDPASLISRALHHIDSLFGQNPFLKSQLVHRLPASIVGNRQPIKAITEYLCHEKYLVRQSGSKFQRTGKIHKIETLDEIAYYAKKERPASITSPNSPNYYYTEEEGLYAKF